jgi:hypothetical protein
VTTPSFGIATAPSQVAYDDILRVWREADSIPQIEHAWLYDHLMPIFGDAAYAVGSLGEPCTIIRRLWTENEPFDFDGSYHQLTGAFCRPKPVQHPYPPIMIGGRATPTLRVVAEHADRWNMPGGSIEDAIARSAALSCSASPRPIQPRPHAGSPTPLSTRINGGDTSIS